MLYIFWFFFHMLYEILSPGNDSSHGNRNKNNSSVMMIDNHQLRNEIKKLKNQIIIKHQYRISVGTEIVIDLK